MACLFQPVNRWNVSHLHPWHISYSLLRLTLADDNGRRKCRSPSAITLRQPSLCASTCRIKGWVGIPTESKGRRDIPALLRSSTFTPRWLLCLDQVGNDANKTAIGFFGPTQGKSLFNLVNCNRRHSIDWRSRVIGYYTKLQSAIS